MSEKLSNDEHSSLFITYEENEVLWMPKWSHVYNTSFYSQLKNDPNKLVFRWWQAFPAKCIVTLYVIGCIHKLQRN